MEKIIIEIPEREYPVYIGAGAIDHIKVYLSEHFPSVTKLLIITDEHVGERYLERLKNALQEYKPLAYIVPNGEQAKTFQVYDQCLTYALEQKLDRKSLILSFGGGAVGDVSGFVAATYMRGIPFIQLPTTILAHDSAVGGKVAINHRLGKNMIGAFYQPAAVFYDLNFLKSLPAIERRSGFAEVMKHGLIRDADLFAWLKEHISDLQSLTEEQLAYFLGKGIHIKGAIVAADEKETGERAFLNFGHTLGHAIEGEAGYGTMTHGEAIVIGMLFALQLSKECYDLSFQIEEFVEWLQLLGYETKLPQGLDLNHLIERMKQDKKSYANQVQFVLLDKVGSPRLQTMEEDFLREQLERFKKEGVR